MAKDKHLIVIVGPTAIGKTSLSIKLAKYFNCPILSADSRQFFKEISIGTAKPSLQEQDGVKHYFIHSHSIHDEYNVGQFEEEAINALLDIYKTHDIAILVGGSGLYVDAICKGIDDIPKDITVREQLNTELLSKGIEALQEELKEKDPEHYESMNIQNPQRLIRALEVCRATGKTYSSFRKNKIKTRPFKIHKIGLNTDREIVYSNINKRVDIMMKMGLLDEVKSVHSYKHLNSLNTVGYKELFAYIDNELTLDDAIELIKKNTRNFAKRQLTWFRKDENTTWFSPESKIEHILDHIRHQMNNIN